MHRSLLLVLLGLGFLEIVPAGRAEAWPGKITPPPFLKPDPAHAFAELKIFDTNGSPIRVPTDNWERAKQLVATDPGWRDWLAKERLSVNDWMARRHDHVEWISGWYHNFVSPKDGTFLKFTSDEPGEYTLHSASDPRVRLTPQLHAAWVYEFRIHHADMMVEAARLYRLTGETRYADWSAAQLDFYTDHYDHWKTHNGVHFMFQSLDEAVILTRWLAAARLLEGYAAAGRKERWSKKLFEPEAWLLEDTFQVTHNIACWQRSAEGQVAIYTGDAALWHAAIDGQHGIRNEIAQGVTGDYLWFEQSLGYNYYVVRALSPLFEYALMAGKGNHLKPEMETVEDLMLSPLYMRFPNGQLPNPADSGRPHRLPVESLEGQKTTPGPGSEESDVLAATWRIFPTKPGLHWLQSVGEKNWETLLDSPPPPPPGASLPPVTSRNMESSRMAIIRSGPWQVYFHYGQLTGSHAQAEALNFEAFYNNVDVSHDPGTAGYGSRFTTEYFRSGVAHNVPLVDGDGQKAGWEKGSWNPGVLLDFATAHVTAAQPDYSFNAAASRSLAIDGDRLRDEVSLTTKDHREHALGFVLNLQGQVRLPAGFATDPKFFVDHPGAAFSFWKDVKSLAGQDTADFDVVYGNTVIHIRFELPGQFIIYHAFAPDYPPAYREVLYLETHGKKAVLKTTFEPGKH